MKHALALPAALAALLAAALVAETDFVDVPADGGARVLQRGGKVAWIGAVSTNAAFSPTVWIARESWREAVTVDARALTNLTYTVVSTNALGEAYTNVTLTAPAPPYRGVAAFWTNVHVRAWATTNRAVRLAAAVTNAATAGTSYAAPGDALMLSAPADDSARVTVAVER